MNTLHEHLREMLTSMDLQMEIPNTRLHGGCWLGYDGTVCVMCAAGAWYAQNFGRLEIKSTSRCLVPVRKTMAIMDWLRLGHIGLAYKLVHGCVLRVLVPVNTFRGNNLTMDADWRVGMDELLVWLSANNL